jgi:hypothetical protein
VIAAAVAAATLAITAPADQADLPAADISIALEAHGAPAGAHAHVFVDRGPALEADLAKPLVLHDVARGPHAIRAVLVGADHVSVKADGALALARVQVGAPDDGALALARVQVGAPDDDVTTAAETEGRAWPDPKRPILTLVLPSGAANDRPLIDVHLRGATLSRRGFKVRVVVDKRELPLMADEKPRRLRLKPGKHRITVDLLDQKGLKVANAVNRTDRSFVVAK